MAVVTASRWRPIHRINNPRPGAEKKVSIPTYQSTVLLVEDDSDLRIALCALLAQNGYRVRTAGTGCRLLREMDTVLPDIVVSVCKCRACLVRAAFDDSSQYPEIPLIAMSEAFSSNQVPAGVVADAFYQKGTHPTFLMNLVGSMTVPLHAQS